MILWFWKHMYHKKQWWSCERVHPMNFHIILLCCIWLCLGHRDDFVYAPSQWETTLQCNIVSDWLCAYTISFIPYLGAPSNQREVFCVPNFFRLLHWDQGNHIVSEATLNNIGDCLHLHLQDIYIYIFNHSKTNYNQTMCILYGVYSMPDVRVNVTVLKTQLRASVPSTQLRAAGPIFGNAARAPIRSTIGSMGPQKPNEQYIERRWRSRRSQRSQRSWCSCAQPTQPAHPELQFEVL